MEIQKRDIKLSNYNISSAKYNELKYFCMQYDEKRAIPDRQWEVEMIEQTAIEAESEIYPYILKNVTQGIKYEYMDVPCGRRQFYEARRVFFLLLAQKR